MLWDDDTVKQTVTKEFVCSKLKSQDAERLGRTLNFGDDLTDSTYWDWIHERAKRLFLVLDDVGLASRIFEFIDNSLDDEDLHMSLDQLERVLARSRHDKAVKKLYRRQFHYHWRVLKQGGCINYHYNELIPLDVANKRHAAYLGSHIDTVTVLDRPDESLTRCRIPLGRGHLVLDEFVSEVMGVKDVQDTHLLSYWASYTHKGYAYVLFTPALDYSLKSLFTTVPGSLKRLDKSVRQKTVLNWIYCLVKTLSSLHERDCSHGDIRPSTVMFTSENHILFSGLTDFQDDILRGVTDNTPFDREAYDYAAPELLLNLVTLSGSPLHQSVEPGNTPMAATFNSTLNLSEQAADIFSLGCVILELLSFLLKRHGKPFAAHRAAKHKAADRGAIPDASFHKNLGQVESWMAQLAKDASKNDDPFFKSVVSMLHVVEGMLAFYPLERPTAQEVQVKFHQILTEACGTSELHCVQRDSGVDFGMESLTLRSALMQLAPAASNDSSVDVSQDGERKRDLKGTADKRNSGASGASARGSDSILSAGSSIRRGKSDGKGLPGGQNSSAYLVLF